uniref:ABC transporter ATP-binding protein n=1 Tax=unclassified Rhodococcus (in: high G+C Gram-positive bacteria) TaxID=192944 RepID=UPI001C3DF409|nr:MULTISPECIES: ABC transporter ATP-binding protein [unclassified Rhodococcus (in: high G+C Gram-positive bacteria)]
MTTSSDSRGLVLLDSVEIAYSREGSKIADVAVQSTTLRIEAGSFTALLGPSGCGKSSVLRAIAGFVEPRSGSVFLDSAPVHRPGRDRAVVFQQYALLPWLTARGNVEFALHGSGLDGASRRARALELLNSVGLEHAADRRPDELSGGMQQRVSIARALATEPAVLLMDEPFGALDAITRSTMQELISAIWKATGVTMVFVTHDVDEALYLGQRIVLMAANPGRLVDDHDLRGVSDSDRASIRNQIIAQLGGH